MNMNVLSIISLENIGLVLTGFQERGFDKKLHQCSQSFISSFKEAIITDLENDKFWNFDYNYGISNFKRYFAQTVKLMNKVEHRCDSKEPTINQKIKESNLF